MPETFDLVVLGGGPAGYVAAIRAAQLGLRTACVDEHARFGGTCLRVGCIPSKALLESSHLYWEARHGLEAHGVKLSGVELDLPAMLKRKEEIVERLTGGINQLLKRNKVKSLVGRGRIVAPGRVLVEGEDSQEIEFKNLLIATGSSAARIPSIEYDDDRIGDSTAALSYPTAPKRLCVIGAGYIGLELGSVWNRLGAEVTVLEALDRVLPGLDAEIAKIAHRLFEKQGLKFRLGVMVASAKVEGEECVVELKDGEKLTFDRVLVAVGRRPNTQDLGLEMLGVETDPRGFIPVDGRFSTTAPGVYAVGDCIGGAMLAHKASEEAVACVERIAGKAGHINYDAIPAVVYTHPEIAAVGRTEEQLKEAGVEYRRGICPFGAIGRAMTLGDTDGRVKFLADAQTDRILGVHAIGNRAGDLIAEAAAAMEFGASSEDIARLSHAHPTLSEAMKEAALAVHKRAIHT